MKREPVYYFKTQDETGISEVPANSLVIVEDGDKGEDLEIYILDTDPNHIKTLTLRKYLQNNSHLYKMGGLAWKTATEANAKAIKANTLNIATNTTDITKLDDRVTVNAKGILDNERDILKNENNIGYNRVQIDRNTKETDKVNRDVIQNTKDIGHNHDHIEHNEQRIIVLEKAGGVTPNPANKIDSYYFSVDKGQLSSPEKDPTKADIVAILKANNIIVGKISGHLYPNVAMTLNITESATSSGSNFYVVSKNVYMISIESGNTSVFAMTKMTKMV